MGKILVIYGSDFSRNQIDKVTIVEKTKYLEQVEKTVNTQTPISYSSSTVSDNNPSLKNNDQ